MLVYSLIYFFQIVFSFIELNSDFSNSDKKLFTFIQLLPLYILSAFRDVSVGTDTSTYFRAYNSVNIMNTLGDNIQLSRMEPGYVTLEYMCKLGGFSFLVLQIIISTFIYFSFYNFIQKNSENVSFSCSLFVSLKMFCGIMNTTRMWIAIAILLYSYEYIKSQKIIRFSMVVIIASLFHRTALIFLILYFLSVSKKTKRSIIIVFLITIIVFFMRANFFNYITEKIGVYQDYITGQYFEGKPGIVVYIGLLVNLSIILFSYSNKAIGFNFSMEKKTLDYKKNMLSMSAVVILSLSIIGLTNTIMSRISAYFIPAVIIFFPNAINNVKEKKYGRIALLVISILLYFMFYVVLKLRPGWYGVTNYKFWNFNY